jgi:ATP-dependent helicase/nuclease subunit B
MIAARALAERLSPLLTAAPASAQLTLILDFLDAHARPTAAHDALGPRLDRGRAAVREALRSLAAAHAEHDDRPMTIVEAASAVHRWIEEQTFLPDPSGHGVQLLDDQAARFGEFDRIAIVGLIEGEWPDRPQRNIFYPPALLAALGWPTEQDRRGAAEARFLELLASASERVSVSTVTLDDEALVEPSTIVEDIARARLPIAQSSGGAEGTAFTDEALMTRALTPSLLSVLDADAAEWAVMRAGRSPAAAPEYHGRTGSPEPQMWSVSALETYLGCPFRFFAQHVLKLREEPEDEETMDPRTQGEFVHGVFERFFERWQKQGHHAITPANLDAARHVFVEVVEASLARLSDTEAGLERTRLLGSPAAAGLGEAVFRMEAERPVAVVERLLEHRLKGDFVVTTSAGLRTVLLNGKADRLDLLADGTFRLIDYKLGWPPNRARALQLPVYAICAEQALDGRHGRHWTLGEAAYVAFKGPKRVVPVVSLSASADDRHDTLADAQERLVATIDAINLGLFPPTPDDVYRCETCSYAAVCRTDYVGDV